MPDTRKIKQYIKRAFEELPFYFEKYEAFIILIGALLMFLMAGFIFYTKAYRVVETTPKVDVSVERIRSDLFDKTIEELKQRKEAAPDLPIIDPFR